MLEIKGIAVSEGIAFADAYCLVEPDLSFKKETITDVQAEIERFKKALAQSKVELQEIVTSAQEKFGEEKAAIFVAHLLLLEDPEMLAAIEEKMKLGSNAEYALHEVSKMFISMFEGMDNVYMQERAADIRDVSKRLLAHLLHVELPDIRRLASDVIIVAEDLTPSMTAQLDTKYVKGFITDIGGRTSHSAILARTLDIPAIVGTKTATKEIKHGTPLIMDGTKGNILMNVTPEMAAFYMQQQQVQQQQRSELSQYVTLLSQSADGHSVEIAGNIGKPEDVEKVLLAAGTVSVFFERSFCIWSGKNSRMKKNSFKPIVRFLKKCKGSLRLFVH